GHSPAREQVAADRQLGVGRLAGALVQGAVALDAQKLRPLRRAARIGGPHREIDLVARKKTLDRLSDPCGLRLAPAGLLRLCQAHPRPGLVLGSELSCLPARVLSLSECAHATGVCGPYSSLIQVMFGCPPTSATACVTSSRRRCGARPRRPPMIPAFVAISAHASSPS